MDKAKLTAVFNLGFRSGADDREAAGLVISGTTTPPPPAHVPAPPGTCATAMEQKAWQEGYTMGFTMGASSSELARETNPAAHGMVSALDQEMVEMFGVFKRLSKTP
jgi:hypothetical protein